MLKKRYSMVLVAVVLMTALLFSTIMVVGDTYEHKTAISVTDTSGTNRANVPIKIDTIKGDNLIAAGFVNENATNTRVLEGLANTPFLVCDDKLIFVATNLSADQEKTYDFYTGYTPPVDSFALVLGQGGYVTVVDNSTLEPGSAFAFGIIGYIDTASGADKNIIRKDGAVVFNVTSTKELTFAITGGNSLVATNVTSGVHTMMIYSDGVELWMDIDDVEQDRVGASSIPDTGNNWTLFENDVMPYVYYYGEWVAA